MAKQLYFNREGVQPHLNGIPTPNVAHVPAVTSQAAEIVGDLAKLAGTATKAYLHAQEVKQAGLVDEAYLKARGQMLTWQNEYNRTHKAGDALDAQRDYETQWQTIAQGIQQEYGGRLGDMYMGRLNRSMELGRLYALSHGGAYQEKETAAWGKNQTDLLGMNVMNAVDSGDMMQVQMERQRLADHLGRIYPGQDISPYMQKLDAGIFERRFEGMIARGDVEQAESLLQGLSQSSEPVTQAAPGGGGRVAGVPSQTGVGTLLAKYESGSHGSSHVSYGLPHTDGVDAGKYSFITKGKNGGSVGEFVRWMGQNGGEVGEKLYSEMNTAVGGNWANLDNKAFWKSKGEKIWRDAIHSNPLAFEQGEDAFMSQYRFDPVMKQLRPEVREAIQNDQSGALREVAMSTINQHSQAVKILNGAYKDGITAEDWIKAVYQERGNPARFAKTGDPNMGRRRFAREQVDALAMLHGGGESDTVNQAGKPEGTDVSVGASPSNGEPEHQQMALPPGIDPARYLRMRNQLDAYKKRRAAQSGITKETFSNHITFGMEKGDFSYAEKDIVQLKSFGMQKEAAEMQEKLDMSRAAFNITSNMLDTPFAEQKSKAIKQFDLLLTPDNAKSASTMREHIRASIDKSQNAFIKDPAAYVNQLPYIQGLELPQERIAASLKKQEELGKGLSFQTRVLPKQESEQLRRDFDNLKTGDDRAVFLYSLRNQMGEYTDDVLREMKMPAAVSLLMPTLDVLGRQELGLMLTGLTTRDKDIPKVGSDEWKEMKDAVSNDFELLNVVRDASRARPNNDNLRAMANGLMTAGYYYMKATGKSSFEDIDKAYSLSTSYNHFLVLPKHSGYDADDVATAIEQYKANGHLQNELEKRGALSIMGGGTHRTKLLRRENLLENATFFSTEDGKSLYIVNPNTERPLLDNKGKLVVIKIDDVLKVYGNQANEARREEIVNEIEDW